MASEPAVLADDFGDVIEVEVDENLATMPDGSISPAGAVMVAFRVGKLLTRMRLSGERLAAFREAVDRAAMPGQPATEAAGGCPQPGCSADPATASGGLPPKWCTGACRAAIAVSPEPVAQDPASISGGAAKAEPPKRDGYQFPSVTEAEAIAWLREITEAAEAVASGA